MNEIIKTQAPIDNLDARSDQQLRALIETAQALLEQRDRERKKKAMEQIQDIAKTHGLSVNISTRSRRGRPPKKPQD